MKHTAFVLVLVLALVVGAVHLAPPAQAASADPSVACFSETGHCVSGAFKQFWETRGGLAIYGFPITEPFVENGRTVQYFERQRLEAFPENPPPFQVQGGLLGVQVARQQGLTTTPPFLRAVPNSNPACRFFPETGHNLCFGFRTFWETHGGLATFGFPISDAFAERNPPPPAGDGREHDVQYFERARFEFHPENAEPFRVELGLLGQQIVPRDRVAFQPVDVPAVQAVLDYFQAINNRDFQRAFGLLTASGAGGQSFSQFVQFWSNTVQVSVQVGSPTPTGANVSVGPVAVPLIYFAEVVNDPRTPTGQRVRQFQATYSVQQQAAGAWRIEQRVEAEIAGNSPLPAAFADPATLVRSYWEAIGRRDFARAYTDWDSLGQASGQTFAQFVGGFSDTTRVVADVGQPGPVEGAAGSLFVTVPVVVIATHTDGTTHTFCGTLTLHRANVPPFDQFGWRISTASIVETANVPLGSDAEKRLLTGSCPA